MEAEKEKSIQEKISAYRLMGTLMGRLRVVIVGGVARSTVYKAFSDGGGTPLLEKVLEVASEVIEQHEASVAQSQEMVGA